MTRLATDSDIVLTAALLTIIAIIIMVAVVITVESAKNEIMQHQCTEVAK